MSIVERAKRIMLSPKEEWPVIEAEPATVGSIYTGYVIPLAAIPPIAGFIGTSLVGIAGFRYPIGMGLGSAVTGYVLGLASVYLLAVIINALAPSFDGTSNMVAALKVSAYSYTAAWVAGILTILPILGIITLLISLYCLYLIYTGLPVLMKSPPEKAMGYTVVVIIAAIVIFIVFGMIARSMFTYNPMLRGGM